MSSFIVFKLKSYRSMLPVILIMTAMTLIFIYIFGIGFSKPYVPKVAIVDLDGTKTGTRVKDQLKQMKGFEFVEKAWDEAEESMIIVIEEGAAISLYKSGSSVEQIALENKINLLLSELKTDQEFTKDLSLALEKQGVSISEEDLYHKLGSIGREYITYTQKEAFHQREDFVEYNTIKNYFAGFLLFFSMFIVMFGIGGIVEEKELRVWQRQNVSPLSRFTILMGNLISNFIVGMAQLIFVILISKLLFDMDWGGSIFALIAVLAAYVIAGTMIGLFISGLVRTQQQLAAILPTVIVATSMIGGCMWPVEMMSSKFLRGFANFLPQKWAVDGVRDVIIYNSNLKDVLPSILYILIIAFVFLILSMLQSKKEA